MPVPPFDHEQNDGEGDRLVNLWLSGAKSAETSNASGAEHLISQIPACQAETPTCQVAGLDQGLKDLPVQATAECLQGHGLTTSLDERRGCSGEAAARARENESASYPNPCPGSALEGRTPSPLHKRLRSSRNAKHEASALACSAVSISSAKWSCTSLGHLSVCHLQDMYERLQMQLDQVSCRSRKQAQDITMLQLQQQYLLQHTLKLERMCRCQHNAADWQVSGEVRPAKHMPAMGCPDKVSGQHCWLPPTTVMPGAILLPNMYLL